MRIESGTARIADDADFIACHAVTNGDRVACVDLARGERLTYREFDRRVARCTGWLESLFGPASGERVAILSRNSIDILVLHFACVRAGAILQPLNWRLPGPELRGLVEDASPALFAYQTEFEGAAEMAVRGKGIEHLVRIAPNDNRLTAAIAAAPESRSRGTDPDAPITLLYTSGTTGRPKGVIVTRRNAWTTAVNFSMANDVAQRDVLLCDMPMFHVAGLFGVSRSALFMGGTVLISDRFTPQATLARLSDRALGITHFFAVPQMVATLVQDPAYASSDLSRLKALVIGGAPLPKSLVVRLLADGIMPVEGYGSSEAGTVLHLPIDRDMITREAGSCGVPAMLIDVRLVGQDGRDAATGEVGELWLRGPSVTPGYWNQPEATAKAFEDGWFKTGDAAVCNADGFYRIVDRWKDMYISGGENVYPAEIESVLAEHAAIAEAAVVGVPDARWGESGCAFIVLRSDRIAAPAEILAHCRERLAGYKNPRYVRLVDALPRTASGKVKKDELRRAFTQTENVQ
jgi:fatty-acyl-CoA synthase